ncbi:hypothetical protein BATDEDRAFT_23619 [Batrachochytrium dendrobatidis JAM81]|uniref:Pleckstrin homology domain-containing protein n=2 Tax=Batrachochytrium dendrobatidis TaxID=109871 RepID=F4NXV1_BATDJ|nr:uncharacterized protein BATDEDRAFT_23619 [Batrachochytrium dendrobatidis JAM81]EGF81911.1 hypothetical protein BATDEDRAFT_23619 [Batrachochytrium dendrobatidis JAM81]OAJ40593.1 hypothetical protein BDEG_24308 [Batrachochytrium dendrobatidis JEL423]|eukprot:XP_006677329.1 hypothetical protein BATDEDRAFT_23619 [Batrachochytrium dendrobatidis JAM81]
MLTDPNDDSNITSLSHGSVGAFSDYSKTGLLSVLHDLQEQLADRDRDCELAANVGQSMLVDIQRLQKRITELESLQLSDPNKLLLPPIAAAADLSVDNNSTPKTTSSVYTNDDTITPKAQFSKPTFLTSASDAAFQRPVSASASMKRIKKRVTANQKSLHTLPNLVSTASLPQQRYIGDSRIAATDKKPSTSNSAGIKLDASLASEIEMSLVVQTRELRFRVTEEHTKRCNAETKLNALQAEYDTLKQKNDQLQKSQIQNADTTWNLQVESSELQDHITDLTEQVEKLARNERLLQAKFTQQKELVESTSAKEQELTKECESLKAALDLEHRKSQRKIAELQREHADTLKKLEDERRALVEPKYPSWRKHATLEERSSTHQQGQEFDSLPVLDIHLQKNSMENTDITADKKNTSQYPEHRLSKAHSIGDARLLALQQSQSDMDAALVRVKDISEHADNISKERNELEVMLESTQMELQHTRHLYQELLEKSSLQDSNQANLLNQTCNESLYWSITDKTPICHSSEVKSVLSNQSISTQTDIREVHDVASQILIPDSGQDSITHTSSSPVDCTLSSFSLLDSLEFPNQDDLSCSSHEPTANMHIDSAKSALIEKSNTDQFKDDDISSISAGSSQMASEALVETSSHISAWNSANPDVNGIMQMGVDCVTFTMIGSYFHKYNRSGKKTQLRYCWIQPNTRCIHWTEKDPSQAFRRGLNVKGDRSLYIESMQWTDPPLTIVKNFPPTETNAIIINSPSRSLKLVPLSWENHDKWISSIKLLILKTRPSVVPLHQQLLMSDHSDEVKNSSNLNGASIKNDSHDDHNRKGFDYNVCDEHGKNDPCQTFNHASRHRQQKYVGDDGTNAATIRSAHSSPIKASLDANKHHRESTGRGSIFKPMKEHRRIQTMGSISNLGAQRDASYRPLSALMKPDGIDCPSTPIKDLNQKESASSELSSTYKLFLPRTPTRTQDLSINVESPSKPPNSASRKNTYLPQRTPSSHKGMFSKMSLDRISLFNSGSGTSRPSTPSGHRNDSDVLN